MAKNNNNKNNNNKNNNNKNNNNNNKNNNNNRPSNNRPAPSRPSGGGNRTPMTQAQVFAQESAAAAQRIAQRQAAGNTSTPTTSTKPEIKGLGQGIRLASGGGGISKSELNTLMDSGKNQGQIIRQLDKVNTRLKENGKGSINLKSGAANMLIRQSNKTRSDIFGAGRRDFNFGAGRIGQQLGDMSGLNTPINIPNRMMAGGGWTPKGKEFEPEFLTRGIDLTGRGATGKTVRGVGKEYEGLLPKPEPELEPQPEETGPEEVFQEPIPEPEKEEEIDNSASSGAGGLDLASWATGFKQARSARQKLGRQAQGLSSQKKSPFKSWNS